MKNRRAKRLIRAAGFLCSFSSLVLPAFFLLRFSAAFSFRLFLHHLILPFYCLLLLVQRHNTQVCRRTETGARGVKPLAHKSIFA
ncbi:hypothetical protein Dole_0053 [Desulfosudis oleivorans Hxd3]|uniref:Uncharacterized protein n=1 Tax=Desulfosudis oleivorans (strain DSM 6200 / JCM 39069 / Hxd3) TaxID=96561 RepID=A8ZRU6_DESOH|nr:hypothetical protein Dole_0053 [Desulfosudis oleivorans Hxd3]